MEFLNELDDFERDTVISLPYRVGRYVSMSDTTGGDEADQVELELLRNILHGFTQEVFGSELLQHVMSECVRNQHRWGEWNAQVPIAPEDCKEAIRLVELYAGAKEAHAFQTHLMEIGEAVALAFSEHEHESALSQFMRNVAYSLRSLFSKRKQQSRGGYLSISPKERKALKELAQALGTVYDG